MRNNPKLLKEIDEIEYLLYKPTILNMYWNCYTVQQRPEYCSRIIHRVRMLRELLFAHYEVVYMKKDGKIIGHLVVSRGGTRIAASNKKDIVIGPIWIVSDERKKGYGSIGIGAVLNELGYEYEYAYEYISRDNTASIKAAEKNGYKCLGNQKEYGFLKTIKPCKDGKLLLYRYMKTKDV